MKGQGTQWTPIYMLIVIAIAAVLLVTFIKPLFQVAAAQASENAQQAEQVAGAAFFLLKAALF